MTHAKGTSWQRCLAQASEADALQAPHHGIVGALMGSAAAATSWVGQALGSPQEAGAAVRPAPLDCPYQCQPLQLQAWAAPTLPVPHGAPETCRHRKACDQRSRMQASPGPSEAALPHTRRALRPRRSRTRTRPAASRWEPLPPTSLGSPLQRFRQVRCRRPRALQLSNAAHMAQIPARAYCGQARPCLGRSQPTGKGVSLQLLTCSASRGADGASPPGYLPPARLAWLAGCSTQLKARVPCSIGSARRGVRAAPGARAAPCGVLHAQRPAPRPDGSRQLRPAWRPRHRCAPAWPALLCRALCQARCQSCCVLKAEPHRCACVPAPIRQP